MNSGRNWNTRNAAQSNTSIVFNVWENRLSYKENRSRKERAHRLITRGAAVESILPQVKGLSEVQFYSLMEEILTRPENAAEIERLLKGGN